MAVKHTVTHKSSIPGEWVVVVTEDDGSVLHVQFSGLEASRHADEYAAWKMSTAPRWQYNPARRHLSDPGETAQPGAPQET